MKYRLIKTIRGFAGSRRYSDLYIFYVELGYKAKCLDKTTLECVWQRDHVYNGFINGDVLVAELEESGVLLYSLVEQKVLKVMEGRLNAYPGRFSLNYYYSIVKSIDAEQFLLLQYDLKSNQILKEQISKYTVDFLLDDFNYLSLTHNRDKQYEYNTISKVNFCCNTVAWEYSISDLGPFLEFCGPPEQVRPSDRTIYNLYFKDGMVLATISKGIVALSAETGQLLWWVDFNSDYRTAFLDFEPHRIAFFDGKIYSRDWHEFLSIDMLTGKILLQKEYIGFKIGDKVVNSTGCRGLTIHNGKGYFVLDVDAELYLISMDLDTAEVHIETELPDVKDQVHAEDIYFEGNRMYIVDCADFLYVYEILEE